MNYKFDLWNENVAFFSCAPPSESYCFPLFPLPPSITFHSFSQVFVPLFPPISTKEYTVVVPVIIFISQITLVNNKVSSELHGHSLHLQVTSA